MVELLFDDYKFSAQYPIRNLLYTSYRFHKLFEDSTLHKLFRIDVLVAALDLRHGTATSVSAAAVHGNWHGDVSICAAAISAIQYHWQFQCTVTRTAALGVLAAAFQLSLTRSATIWILGTILNHMSTYDFIC